MGCRAGPGPWRGLDVRRGARDATALAVRALHSKPRRDGRARSRRSAHLRRADESAELGLGVATMALDRRGMVANDLCRCAGPTHGLAGRAGARAAPRCPPRPSPRTRCSPPAPPAFACVASAAAEIVLGRAARGRVQHSVLSAVKDFGVREALGCGSPQFLASTIPSYRQPNLNSWERRLQFL